MELLSIPRAAVQLDCSPAAIFKWLRLGRVRGYRVGSRVRVALPDLLELKPAGTYAPLSSTRHRDASGQFCKTA